MKLGLILASLIVLLIYALGAQADTIVIASSGIQEPGTTEWLELTAISGNSVAVGIPITIDGDIGRSGVTDSQGKVRFYFVVPDVNRLNFKAHWGALEQEGRLPIARGHWSLESNVAGSFSGNYAVSASESEWPTVTPTVSWSANCAGSHGVSTKDLSQGKLSALVKTGAIDIALGAVVSYITAPASAAIVGGVAITDNEKWSFTPNPGSQAPSKSVLHRVCQRIKVSTSAYFVNGTGSMTAAVTAVGAFYPPVIQKASCSVAGNSQVTPPVDDSMSLPDKIVRSGTFSEPMSRANSAQCNAQMPGVGWSDGQNGNCLAQAEINESIFRTNWSEEIPKKGGS